MKKLFSFFILTILAFNAKAQWTELDSGVDGILYDVYAITPDIVVAVGYNGIIIKTTDGGETWQQKDSGTTEPLRKVQFPTPEIGYIISASNALLKTTDGGETWLPLNAGTNCFYFNLSCVNENLVFVTCNGNLMKSVDGGNNWIEIGLIGAEELQFLNNNIGYFAGYEGFFKTENGGETWIFLSYYPNTVQFLDENIGFFYSGGLYKTIDGGYNFELLGYGVPDGFMDISVIDETTTWGILYGLLNGDGSTWGIVKVNILEDGTYAEEVLLENDPYINMYSIHFTDENTGYIVGYNHNKGAIWKNNNGINTMQTVEENNKNTIRIYPNPASEEINIIFGSTENSEIKLTDMTGKQLYSAEFHESKIRLDTKQFAKGVYILSVITKQKKYSQKIIIN